MRSFRLILAVLLFALAAKYSLAISPAIKLEMYDPNKPAVTPLPNSPGKETCTADFGVGAETMENWFIDSLNRIWLFTAGLSGTAPNRAKWVAEKKELYLSASQTLFGVRSAFMARALLKLHITLNYPGRPAPVGRVQIPIGTQVTEDGFMTTYRQTYNLLLNMSCSERLAFIQPSTGTPLFAYSDKVTPLTVKINQQTIFSGTIFPPQQLVSADGNKLRFITTHYNLSSIPQPAQTLVVNKNRLSTLLNEVVSDLQLTAEEAAAYLRFLNGKIPSASYYRVGFFEGLEANKLVPLSTSPAPTRMYQFILYLKPLVAKPTESSNWQKPKPLLQRTQLTIVDLAVLIDW